MSELTLKNEGSIPVKISNAFISENKKYASSLFEVCIEVQDCEDNFKEYTIAFGDNYCKGYFSDKTETQVGLKRLKDLGLTDNDLSSLPDLVGVCTYANQKASNCGKYLNITFLGEISKKSKPMDLTKAKDLAEMIKRTAGVTTSQTSPLVDPFDTTSSTPF